MTIVYVVISTRNLSWGEDRRDMLFDAEEAAKMAADKVRKKFADENIDGYVKVVKRLLNNKKFAEDTEYVHCLLH